MTRRNKCYREVPQLASLLFGASNEQAKDGFIRLRGFPFHPPMPRWVLSASEKVRN